MRLTSDYGRCSKSLFWGSHPDLAASRRNGRFSQRTDVVSADRCSRFLGLNWCLALVLKTRGALRPLRPPSGRRHKPLTWRWVTLGVRRRGHTRGGYFSGRRRPRPCEPLARGPAAIQGCLPQIRAAGGIASCLTNPASTSKHSAVCPRASERKSGGILTAALPREIETPQGARPAALRRLRRTVRIKTTGRRPWPPKFRYLHTAISTRRPLRSRDCVRSHLASRA
jgi:hypothetical protein